ncbi:MAG TPA: dienelactone hydrolase family protein [Pyrinomonadaceae bacterium]|nr:dienelactone hydrolase family protein [Pyrinomonadaceae bacterium]
MAQATKTAVAQAKDVEIHSGAVQLNGDLSIPVSAQSVVLFAHGSGSSRHSPRNQFVARTIREAGVGTLLFDLLTKDEEAVDVHTAHLRFDIGLLAERLIDATYWVKGEFDYLSVGYFGSSTGGGAALVAAAELGDSVGAVVSRGGRPDLAGDALPNVKAPTLLIVGGLDYPVIEMNKSALARMRCEKELKIVPGATHLFQEPGTLQEVARLAADWFQRHLHSVVAQ